MILLTGFGFLLLSDAVIGMSILYQLFSRERKNIAILEEFLSEEDKGTKTIQKQYNDRVPKILRSNQLAE